MAPAPHFTKATREQAKLRLAIVAPSGGGKTWTALAIGTAIAEAEGGRVALIDTEHGSASKYADLYDFDTLALTETDTESYVAAIRAAEAAGYAVIILDSGTHAWETMLEQKDIKAARGGNSFTAWAEISPRYRAFTEAQTGCRAHIITTIRAKTEYVLEDRGGKQVPKKVGLAGVIRPGYEYEYDIVAYMDIEHNLTIDKTRYAELDGKSFRRPGREFGTALLGWLRQGAAPAQRPVVVQQQAPPPPAAFPRTIKAPEVHPGNVPDEVERLWRRIKGGKEGLPSVLQVCGEMKADIIETTGSEAGYYEVLARHGLKHANELKGTQAARHLVRDLYEYLTKARAALEPPPEPYQATDDDLPPELGGAS